MYSKRIFVVAVVDSVDYFAVDYSVGCLDYYSVCYFQPDCWDSDLQKDLRMTAGIFSTDETLFQRRHRPVGVGTWWSTCCIALRAWPAGCRADRDGPVRETKIDN